MLRHSKCLRIKRKIFAKGVSFSSPKLKLSLALSWVIQNGFEVFKIFETEGCDILNSGKINIRYYLWYLKLFETFTIFETPWIVINYFNIFWDVQNFWEIQHFWCIWNSFETFEILLRHLKSFWDIWNHFETFEIILRHLKLFWDIWNYFETFKICLPKRKTVDSRCARYQYRQYRQYS